MRMSTPLPKVFSGIGKRIRKKPPALISDMAWLVDVREECFAILIADGIPLAFAYKTAGFTDKDKVNSARQLYAAPRIQARTAAILKARASSPAVTLPEITDMLKRVYVGAIHSGEYNPAHNAAFSLARLYGLVVDRAQLDVIRRPSREPDAPAEQALSSWIAELPAYNPGPQVPSPQGQGPGLLIEGSAYGSDLDTTRAGPGDGPDGIENGAPTRPVTGTPSPRAHSPRAHSPRAHSNCGSPFSDEGTALPRAEDLF